MERPNYDSEPHIKSQFDVYAMGVTDKFFARPKTVGTVLSAITEAFILGAGGYEGSFDAACVLEAGGLDVLIESLGLVDVSNDPNSEIDTARFEVAVRAAVDYGAAWDQVEAEIPDDAISEHEVLPGSTGIFGTLTEKFIRRSDTGYVQEPWQDPGLD